MPCHCCYRSSDRLNKNTMAQNTIPVCSGWFTQVVDVNKKKKKTAKATTMKFKFHQENNYQMMVFAFVPHIDITSTTIAVQMLNPTVTIYCRDENSLRQNKTKTIFKFFNCIKLYCLDVDVDMNLYLYFISFQFPFAVFRFVCDWVCSIAGTRYPRPVFSSSSRLWFIRFGFSFLVVYALHSNLFTFIVRYSAMTNLSIKFISVEFHTKLENSFFLWIHSK